VACRESMGAKLLASGIEPPNGRRIQGVGLRGDATGDARKRYKRKRLLKIRKKIWGLWAGCPLLLSSVFGHLLLGLFPSFAQDFMCEGNIGLALDHGSKGALVIPAIHNGCFRTRTFNKIDMNAVEP